MTAGAVTDFVSQGPLLDWLDTTFLHLSDQVRIPAGHLRPGFPPTTTSPDGLRVDLTRLTHNGENTDWLWADIVAQTRQPDPVGALWQLITVGLALADLRRAAHRFPILSWHDRCELHADLAEGFCRRLGTIDTERPNILARLVDSAKGYAQRRRKRHRPQIPTPLPWLTSRLPHPGGPPTNLTEALTQLAEDLTANDQPIDPIDLELLARVHLDGETTTTAATALGLNVQAAYKRRQRLETRIARHYRIT